MSPRPPAALPGRGGRPGLTPAPGVPGGLPSRNLAAHAQGRRPGPARLPEAGQGGARPPARPGGHPEAGETGGDGGSEPRRGGPGPRPPTSKLSTLMGERGSRISASSFFWRLAPAPSPGTSSGAPGIFPAAGGRLMPPPGPHCRCPRCPRSGPAAAGPSAAPEPPAPGGAPPGPTAAAASSGGGSQRRSGAWACARGRPGPARPERPGAGGGVPAPRSDSRRPVRSSAAGSLLRAPRAGAGKRRRLRGARAPRPPALGDAAARVRPLRPPPARAHDRGRLGARSPLPSHTPARRPSPAARRRYPQAPRPAAAGARPLAPPRPARAARPAPPCACAPRPAPARGPPLLAPFSSFFPRFPGSVPRSVSPFRASLLPPGLPPLFSRSPRVDGRGWGHRPP